MKTVAHIGKRIILNAGKHGFAQVARQTRARTCAVYAGSMPQNIASTAITAINAPMRATCPMSPTAMPLSMMDPVKYGIKISRMTPERRIHRREEHSFFILPDFLRNLRTGDTLFPAGLFFFSHSIFSPFLCFLFLTRSSSMQSSCLNSEDAVISNTRPTR
ncbi:MAG: hypothetical protein V8Q79_08675 [Christensenellales bacterium]